MISWKSVHYLCILFVFFSFEQTQAILGLQFLEDLHRNFFIAPWIILVVADRIINGKFIWLPWQRKDADKEVVNDERDRY
jgi:hypothetical protein